jgi:hypothetical protein
VFEENGKHEPAKGDVWWHERRDDLLALADAQPTPLYVYNEDSLHEAADELLKMKSVDRIFYSIKANPNPQIIRLFAAKGLGFECVSPGEVEHILTLLPELDRRRFCSPPISRRARNTKRRCVGRDRDVGQSVSAGALADAFASARFSCASIRGGARSSRFRADGGAATR